jgi:tRNA modification GTPase
MPTQKTDRSTLAVLLTAPGRGAVATVLVAGPRAIEVTAELFSPHVGNWPGPDPWGKVRFGRWPGPQGEEVVVAALGPTQVEVHCHGGLAAPQAILRSLAERGCEQLDWQSWLAASDTDPIRTEARQAIALARTERTAALLLDQLQGALARACREITQRISQSDRVSARTIVAEILRRAPLGRHLTEPWKVVLAGPPNVGKSSLINALVGYGRAIVHDLPGTTRDVVTAAASFGGWPVELSDTAGLRSTGDPLEAAGVELAASRLPGADAIVLVFDIRQPWDEDARRLIARWPAAMVVYNKADLASLPADGRPAGLCTSAVEGRGLSQLEQAIEKKLVPLEPAAGTAIPFTSRQVDCLEQIAAVLELPDGASALAFLEQLCGSACC